MRSKLVAVAVLATVGVGALVYALGGVGANAAEIPEYLTAPATVGDVTDEIAATGAIAATSRTGVAFGVDPFEVDDGDGPSSPAPYAVTDVSVQVGDRVAIGDPLATADSADLERQLDAATNDLLTAKIDRNAAEDALDEAEDDEDSDQIYQAQKQLYAAQNQVSDAQAKVDDLKAQIAGATLRAPVAGLITEVAIRPGFDAPSGAAIVIDAATYEVTTDVVESDLVEVDVGQTASIRVDAIDADLTGTVTAISPISGSDSGGSGVVSYPVTVTLDEAPDELRSGMSADVTITTASATDVLTVPSAALVGRNGEYAVRTLDADGNPVPTPVEVGLVTATTAEITSGLTEGQAVIIGTASDLAGTTSGQNGFGGVAVPGGGPIIREGGPMVRPNVEVGP
jgi:macrolide-specific efflux system membrane fusion protein